MVYDGKSTLNAENMLFRKSRSDHSPWLFASFRRARYVYGPIRIVCRLAIKPSTQVTVANIRIRAGFQQLCQHDSCIGECRVGHDSQKRCLENESF